MVFGFPSLGIGGKVIGFESPATGCVFGKLPPGILLFICLPPPKLSSLIVVTFLRFVKFGA